MVLVSRARNFTAQRIFTKKSAKVRRKGVKMLTKQEALRELVFDSLQELREFVYRIELRKMAKGQKLVIVFASLLGLKQWQVKESQILERMRQIYKERGLKDIVIFNKVVAEAKGQNLLYKERSKGEFKILSHSPEIRAIFERIQSVIKENLQRERV